MLREAACFLMLGFVLSGTTLVAEEKEKDRNKVAIAAAEKWLRIVDEEKYAESWQETAERFKRSVTADQWRQALDGTRKPLGKQIARKVKKSSYVTSVPGGPDGQYVIIEFAASFENKKTAIETVTPMLEKDGVWRVAGYYIK